MTTINRSCLYGVLPLLLATAVGAAETVYTHTVSLSNQLEVSMYVSVKEDQTAKLRTVPADTPFVANSGYVVESETKRHSTAFWIETKDTATEHEAKSPSIKAYRSTFAECIGRFQAKRDMGVPGRKRTEPIWVSQLREPCGHIIVAWYYPGDLQNPLFLRSGETLRERYILLGEPVVLVSIGAGGELKSLSQLVKHLRSQELTLGKSVSFDSIGHGGQFSVPNADKTVDDHSSLQAVDDTTIKNVIPATLFDVLEDKTTIMSDNDFIAPVVPELRCGYPVITLYHCFSASPGIVAKKTSPSIAERIKVLVPKMKVRGVKGLCTNPGPTGDLVEF